MVSPSTTAALAPPHIAIAAALHSCIATVSAPIATSTVAVNATTDSAAFAFSNVSVNDAAPSTLADLIQLGQHRHDAAAISESEEVAQAFKRRDAETVDLDYFNALLAARGEMHTALRNKLHTLRSLRKRNNKLDKLRKSRMARAAAAAAAAKAADKDAGAVADARKGFITEDKSFSTRSGMTDATSLTIGGGSSVVGYTSVDGVVEGWQGEGGIPICSSPVSMDEQEARGVGYGGKPQKGKTMNNSMMMSKGLSYSA